MNKYGAKPVEIDGVRFASTAEGERYTTLKHMERAGHIRDLQLQPAFKCVVNGRKICTYKADFAYTTDKDGRVVEDVKGFKTREYRLKKKLVEALLGVHIVEIAA